MLIGIFLEERDLATLFGDAHRRYQREVPIFLPRLLSRPGTPTRRAEPVLLPRHCRK